MIRPGMAVARAARDLRRNGLRSVALIGGVALGVAMLVFLLAFVSGTRKALLDRVVSSLPITHLTVAPRSFSLAALKFESPFSTLDERAAERIAAIDGVERVLPMAGLRLPAQLRASFFGQGFRTDTGVFGIEPGLVADQLPPGVEFGDGEAEPPYPAVVSSDLIDMFNTGFAEAHDLPRLTPDVLRDQRAVLVLGSSTFDPRGSGRVRPVAVRLVGVSDRVPLVGVSLPLPLVQRWNRELAGVTTPRFLQLTVVAGSAQRVAAIAETIESMGYSVTSGRETARRIRTLTDVLRIAFGLIGAVVLAVAGLGIGNALTLTVMERRHEIGVFRSVGATRADIRLLFLSEAGLIGLAGAALGAGVAAAASRVADWALQRALPDLPFLPPSFFEVSWPIVVAGLTLGLLVSVLAAVSPAHRAARLDPARVLTTA
ncbi:MAG: FtsX-like permease family protein [Gemmatimonadota bacterium]|nr:FtsX-like permease family protein [Gemmatimonadota bacterium]